MKCSDMKPCRGKTKEDLFFMYKEYIDVTNGMFVGISIAYAITKDSKLFTLSLIFVLMSWLFRLLNNK